MRGAPRSNAPVRAGVSGGFRGTGLSSAALRQTGTPVLPPMSLTAGFLCLDLKKGDILSGGDRPSENGAAPAVHRWHKRGKGRLAVFFCALKGYARRGAALPACGAKKEAPGLRRPRAHAAVYRRVICSGTGSPACFFRSGWRRCSRRWSHRRSRSPRRARRRRRRRPCHRAHRCG